MRMLAVLLAALTFLPLVTCRAIAEDTIPAQPNPEVKKFEGTWKLLSLTRDGKEAPTAELVNTRMVFAGNEYSFTRHDGRSNRATFTVEAKESPHVFESSYVDGRDRGKSTFRIYEWVGSDKIRFCSPGPMEKMPTDFVAPFGSGRELAVWERVKKN